MTSQAGSGLFKLIGFIGGLILGLIQGAIWAFFWILLAALWLEMLSLGVVLVNNTKEIIRNTQKK